MRISDNKKAQITLFVIIGLVILIIIGLLLYFLSETKKISLLPESNGALLKSSVDNCINELTIQGAYLLANKGGYIYEYNDSFKSTNLQVAYHLKNKKKTGPDKEYMQQEIKRYLEETLPLCMLSNSEIRTRFGLELGNATAEVTISDEKIIEKITFPVTIISLKDPNKRETVSDYSFSIPLRLGAIIKQKNEIIDKIISDGKVDLQYLVKQDFFIDVIPYDAENIIYTMHDNRSDINHMAFIFNFAIKAKPNAPPEIEPIPDFILGMNKPFNYQTVAFDEDNDTITFYSTNTEVGINPASGLISITPTQKKTYETEICVKDPDGLTDCKGMKLKAQ